MKKNYDTRWSHGSAVMQKYLEISTMTALPWLHPVSKFFFMNALKIADHGIHMTSPDGTSASVSRIIVSIKFGYLLPIHSALEKVSLGLPTNSSC